MDDPVAGKKVSEVFGEIVWLLGQDQATKNLKIVDLERLVMPGIILRQFHIKYARVSDNALSADASQNSDLQPASVEIYALVNEARAAEMRDLPRPLTATALALTDWRSGHERVTVISATLPGFVDIGS